MESNTRTGPVLAVPAAPIVPAVVPAVVPAAPVVLATPPDLDVYGLAYELPVLVLATPSNNAPVAPPSTPRNSMSAPAQCPPAPHKPASTAAPRPAGGSARWLEFVEVASDARVRTILEALKVLNDLMASTSEAQNE